MTLRNTAGPTAATTIPKADPRVPGTIDNAS
jgi:hypothetical protein